MTNVCATQHFLITRWNLRTPAAGYTGQRAPGWTEARFHLFERYCAPSVRAQTHQDFTWLIFCDENTPTPELERLRGAAPQVRTVLRASVKGKGPVGLTPAPHVLPDTRLVISTRLDSDDAIHSEFIERTQASRFDAARWVHNFPDGYKLDTESGRLYRASKPNSPFLSLLERPREVSEVIGVMRRNHSRMPDLFPSVQDTSIRGWLQVVHGGNVLNRITGMDEECADALEAFGCGRRTTEAPAAANATGASM